MKVSDLIDILGARDPDAEVLLSIDPEGNGYRTVECAEPMMFVGTRCHDIEVGYSVDQLSEADIKNGHEPVEGDEWKPCVVVWP